MDPRDDLDTIAKRERMLKHVITELLTTEFSHRANLEHMIEISRNSEFRKHFPENGALLTNLSVIADKTAAMLAVIYRDTPWEDSTKKTVASETAAYFSGDPAALRYFISLIPKIAVAQIECAMLANLYKANPAINHEQQQQLDAENKLAKESWAREKKAPPPTITNDFMTHGPILYTQRFPRYELTLRELLKHIAPDDTETLACVQTAIAKTKEITDVSNALTGYLASARPVIRDQFLDLFKNWERPAAREKIQSLALMLDAIHNINEPTIKAAAQKAFEAMLEDNTPKRMRVINRLLQRMNIISNALRAYGDFLQSDTRDALINMSVKSRKLGDRKQIRALANIITAINDMTNPTMQAAAIKAFDLMILARQSTNQMNDPVWQQRLCNAGPALAVLHQCAASTNTTEAEQAQKFLQQLPQALQSRELITRFQTSDDDPRNIFYQASTSNILNMPAREILLLVAADPLSRERLLSSLGKLKNEDVQQKLEASVSPAAVQFAAFLHLVNHPEDAARNTALMQNLFKSSVTMVELIQSCLAPAAKTPLTPQLPRHATSDSALSAAPKRSASTALFFQKNDREAQKIIEKNAPEIWEVMKRERKLPQKSFSK